MATKKIENGEQGGSKRRGQEGTKNCFSGTLLPTLSYFTSETHLTRIRTYVHIRYVLHPHTHTHIHTNKHTHTYIYI